MRWLASAAFVAARGVVACVGDSTPVDAGGNDATTDVATNDVSTSDASDAGVTCATKGPQLFSPVADAGPFCQGGAAGNHCAFGDHCCMNPTSNTHVCAASCEAGTIDIACFSAVECSSGLACCGNGNVETKACAYPVVGSFTGTVCASSCSSSEFVECFTNAECGSKTCTPAYALDPTNTTTSGITLATCL